VDVTFDQVTTEGTFTAEYFQPPVDELSAELFNSMNFILLSDPMQFWDVTFDGTFEGPVTMTLGYGDSDLLIPEQYITVFHQLPSGGWEALPVIERNLDDNWMTVTTTGFSLFALGALLAVPEPSTFVLTTPPCYRWALSAGDVDDGSRSERFDTQNPA
jgi:hypothetical protein